MYKYRTPELEELHVGFCCQRFSHLDGQWKDCVIDKYFLLEILDEEINDICEHFIRIKINDG